MECKIFAARSRADLQEKVNAWLATHPVTPESMRFQFSSVYMEDPDQHIIEHTLILFYVPMVQIGG